MIEFLKLHHFTDEKLKPEAVTNVPKVKGKNFPGRAGKHPLTEPRLTYVLSLLKFDTYPKFHLKSYFASVFLYHEYSFLAQFKYHVLFL